MAENFEAALTDGLLQGYAGHSDIEGITRAGFEGSSSDYIAEGVHYHDEWFASSNGGGQELVELNGERFTRLYAGGTPNVEVLAELGLTHKDVGSYLIRKIVELERKTRLFTECIADPDSDWQYSYKIISTNASIQITTGEELITYRGVPVHIHMFLLTPIR